MSLIGFIFRRISSILKVLSVTKVQRFSFLKFGINVVRLHFELLALRRRKQWVVCARRRMGRSAFSQEKLEIGQENLHCSVRTMLGFAQGLSLTIAQQEPTTCTLYVIGAGHASSPASGTSPRCNVNIGALQAHNRCFTVAYPGAHLALRCCFKSWP